MAIMGPKIVSEAVLAELDRRKEALTRTVFGEEFSPERSIRLVVTGDWGDDMKEALESFIARRGLRVSNGDL